MIVAIHAPGTDVYGAVRPATSAIAPHRGDVTTVRAAAVVRLRAAERVQKLQAHVASHGTAGTVPLPAAAWRWEGALAPGPM